MDYECRATLNVASPDDAELSCEDCLLDVMRKYESRQSEEP